MNVDDKTLSTPMVHLKNSILKKELNKEKCKLVKAESKDILVIKEQLC
jgi:hypothetical protein